MTKGIVQLGGKVNSGHAEKLEGALVDGVGRQVPIDVVEGHGDELAIVVVVIDGLICFDWKKGAD